MSNFGLWQISGSRPLRVEAQEVALESDLHGWIQEDPELLLSGLKIIGSEVRLDAGRARADLIGVDVQGRLTIIELKRATIFRDTVTQALDYAACLEELDGETLQQVAEVYLEAKGSSLDEVIPESQQSSVFDEEDREIRVIVVGVGQDPALSRLVDFLTRRSDLDVSVVSFQAYSVGETLLLGREVTEGAARRESNASESRSMKGVMDLARHRGTAEHLQLLLSLAEDLGLPARPYKYSVMFTPPSNRTRMLFTASVQSDGGLNVYTYAPALHDFYSVPEESAVARLGPDGWHEMSLPEVREFAEVIRDLIGRDEDE